jgi:hypothetical protein
VSGRKLCIATARGRSARLLRARRPACPHRCPCIRCGAPARMACARPPSCFAPFLPCCLSARPHGCAALPGSPPARAGACTRRGRAPADDSRVISSTPLATRAGSACAAPANRSTMPLIQSAPSPIAAAARGDGASDEPGPGGGTSKPARRAAASAVSAALLCSVASSRRAPGWVGVMVGRGGLQSGWSVQQGVGGQVSAAGDLDHGRWDGL